jgi:nucleoside-triphosphatase
MQALIRTGLLASVSWRVFLCKYSQTQTDKMTTSPLTKPLAASLLSRERFLILLTAPSGAGKTTFCTEIVAQILATGSSVGGFICPAVFAGGKKVGIDMLNVATGERRRLGVRSRNMGKTTVGCWLMDESVIAWGNQILAGLKDEKIIVIDELGPLELEDGYGFQEALCLLDEGRYHTALVVVRPSLLTLARLRWPQAQAVSPRRARGPNGVLDLARESA